MECVRGDHQAHHTAEMRTGWRTMRMAENAWDERQGETRGDRERMMMMRYCTDMMNEDADDDIDEDAAARKHRLDITKTRM